MEFVGHPFVAPDYVSPVRYDPSGPVLLLPGSRQQAVARIFPVLLEGFRAFGKRQAVVLYPSQEIHEVLRAANPPANVRLEPIAEGRDGPLGRPGSNGAPGFAGQQNAPPAITASAVLTSSGTMSMHCALAGIPGAIAYRTNPLTYLMARWWVKIEYIGIANLLLKEPMYPEYIQGRGDTTGAGSGIARVPRGSGAAGPHSGAGGTFTGAAESTGQWHGGRLAGAAFVKSLLSF